METYMTRKDAEGICVLSRASGQCIDDGVLVNDPGPATWVARQPRGEAHKKIHGRDYTDLPACARHARVVNDRGWEVAPFAHVTFAP